MTDNAFYLYVVLSAKVDFDPRDLGVHRAPFSVLPCAHLGVGAGTCYAVTASPTAKFLMPQKGRAMQVWTSMEGIDPLMLRKTIAHLAQDQTAYPPESESLPPGLIYLEQSAPFGMHRLLTRSSNLYGFGVWSQHHEILVLTNVENYDLMLQTAQPRDLWIYRMRSTLQANIAVNTSRVCSRWARWVRESAILSHSSVRFAALESSLFSHPLNP